MKEDTGAKIVIIITIIAALSLFMLSDHSGLRVTDINFEESESSEDTYEFNYTLRVGRTFNSLDCRYVLYGENDHEVSGNIFLGKVYMGSKDISEKITVTSEDDASVSFTPRSVELMFYTEKFDSSQKDAKGNYLQKPIYTKRYVF